MKRALRKEIRERMKRQEENLPTAAPLLPENTKTLFMYFPLGSEIDVLPLAQLALSSGITVAAPRVVGDDLHFHRVTSIERGIVTGAYGIREPSPTSPRIFPPENVQTTDDGSADNITLEFPVLILIPGLAFDREGHRLGRGAGYYDRFLTAFLAACPDKRDEITLAGVCHEFQIVTLVPTESHDIAVDCLLTEKGCIFCIK
jgi:5-formyltetrahydrofolate cyclo-ligase